MEIFNIKNLFLFDGAIFFLVGIAVMVFPSASAAAIPPESGSQSHLEDTRRLLAAFYIALALFLFVFGSNVVNAETLSLASKLRGASLFIVVGVNIWQILNGNWKPQSLWAYIILFSLMGLTYLYSGFSSFKPLVP